MRLLTPLLLLLACDKPPFKAPPQHVRGSHLVGMKSICFQHETADGWRDVGLTLPDGGVPERNTKFSTAIFPTDAGQMRVVECE